MTDTNTARPVSIDFEYTTFGGVKKSASLVPLKRKEAAEVFHNTLLRMLKSGGDIGAILSNLDFESLWTLATKVLKDAVINRHTEIKTIDDMENYFELYPDELMVITMQGITMNWPNFFREDKTVSTNTAKS
jgi:hypothetical protein